MIKTMRGLINAICDADCVRDRTKEGISLCSSSNSAIHRLILSLSKMAPVAVIPPVPVGPLGQPDIQYLPDPIKYAARTKRRQQEDLPRALPDGFPQKLDSDLAWDGNDLAQVYDWNYHLSEDDLKEVEEALQHFKGMHIAYLRVPS